MRFHVLFVAVFFEALLLVGCSQGPDKSDVPEITTAYHFEYGAKLEYPRLAKEPSLRIKRNYPVIRAESRHLGFLKNGIAYALYEYPDVRKKVS